MRPRAKESPWTDLLAKSSKVERLKSFPSTMKYSVEFFTNANLPCCKPNITNTMWFRTESVETHVNVLSRDPVSFAVSLFSSFTRARSDSAFAAKTRCRPPRRKALGGLPQPPAAAPCPRLSSFCPPTFPHVHKSPQKPTGVHRGPPRSRRTDAAPHANASHPKCRVENARGAFTEIFSQPSHSLYISLLTL